MVNVVVICDADPDNHTLDSTCSTRGEAILEAVGEGWHSGGVPRREICPSCWELGKR
jgi:hypothetical protein